MVWVVSLGCFRITLTKDNGEEEEVEVDPEDWPHQEVPDDGAIEASLKAKAPPRPMKRQKTTKIHDAKPKGKSARVTEAKAATKHRRANSIDEEKARRLRVTDAMQN